MATLNNLSSVGTELTEQQLDDVDGGLLVITGALIAFNIGVWTLVGISKLVGD